jgi:hypothetical protein
MTFSVDGQSTRSLRLEGFYNFYIVFGHAWEGETSWYTYRFGLFFVPNDLTGDAESVGININQPWGTFYLNNEGTLPWKMTKPTTDQINEAVYHET